MTKGISVGAKLPKSSLLKCQEKMSKTLRIHMFSGEIDFDSGEMEPQISMNAMNGVSGFHNMRINGHVEKKTVHILIDSGSTHNFLDVNLTGGVKWSSYPCRQLP